MQHDLFLNPAAVASIEPEATSGPLPIEFHRLMPGYAQTELLDCPAIAARLGVARVLIKDESTRMGLPSFKMLGASWAASSAVRREWLHDTAGVLTPEQIGELIPEPQTRRLVAATDGNHGRGVARMASLLGLACTIYVPKGTAASRIADIEGEGATVHVVDGSYDDAIAVSARDADDRTIVVSDTSWEGYSEIPRSVSRGYSTLFREVDDTLARAGMGAPSVVVFQAGVGSFAAAGLRHYRGTDSAAAPRTVIVEPGSANCLMESARAGELVEVPGPHDSTMAGLNCGLPSQLVWPVVAAATDVFLAIDDDAADVAMRLLAESGVVAGESGAASLGGLLSVVDSGTAQERSLLGLDAEASILLVNTEWATDPVNYELVVGVAPHQVESEKELRRTAAGVVIR